MITVEMRVPGSQPGEGYRTAASLTVFDDGTHQLDDPERLVPVDLQVLVATPGETSTRRVAFEEDPATWARHLDTVLRTGYLVPVVVLDETGKATE